MCPNPDFNTDFNKRRDNPGSQKKARKTGSASMPEKNVSWPEVPGKTQGKDRSGGTKKAKIHPASAGL